MAVSCASTPKTRPAEYLLRKFQQQRDFIHDLRQELHLGIHYQRPLDYRPENNGCPTAEYDKQTLYKACCSTRKRRLCLSGRSRRLRYLTLNLEATYQPERPILLTALYINNQLVSPRTRDDVPNIRYTNSIKLKYDQNNLSFELSDLPYSLDEKNKFVYRLERHGQRMELSEIQYQPYYIQ